MEKLKQFFANKHVVTTGGVLLVIAVIWFLLYLVIYHTVGFIASCIALAVVCVIGYFTYQTYMFILGFVEEYKAGRR